MADLEFEGSFEEQWGTVKSAVREHDAILKGNGQEGLVSKVTGREAQIRLLMALVTIFGILTTGGMFVVGILEYNRQVHQNLISPQKIFGSLEPQQAHNQQNADGKYQFPVR